MDHALCVYGAGGNLKQKDYAQAVEYMAFDRDEELNFTVTEIVPAEEGENYSASIDALCERLGTVRESFDNAINPDEITWAETYDKYELLEAHPEYERMEY